MGFEFAHVDISFTTSKFRDEQKITVAVTLGDSAAEAIEHVLRNMISSAGEAPLTVNGNDDVTGAADDT